MEINIPRLTNPSKKYYACPDSPWRQSFGLALGYIAALGYCMKAHLGVSTLNAVRVFFWWYALSVAFCAWQIFGTKAMLSKQCLYILSPLALLTGYAGYA